MFSVACIAAAVDEIAFIRSVEAEARRKDALAKLESAEARRLLVIEERKKRGAMLDDRIAEIERNRERREAAVQRKRRQVLQEKLEESEKRRQLQIEKKAQQARYTSSAKKLEEARQKRALKEAQRKQDLVRLLSLTTGNNFLLSYESSALP